jgi:hypothetical protein
MRITKLSVIKRKEDNVTIIGTFGLKLTRAKISAITIV